MYYVYEWFVVETGEVIYVGKGTNRRHKVRKHNKIFNDMINRLKCNSRIIMEFESERDAFSFEYERVSELKAIGQCVCNIYQGGFGGTTEWWTQDRRDEYSKNNVMKYQTQRERMSKYNPMKNPDIAGKVTAQNRRSVVIDGVKYESTIDATARFGIAHATLKKWCERGISPDGKICRYEDEDPEVSKDGYYRRRTRPIIYNGVRYVSGSDLARSLGVNPTSVLHWAKRGFTPDGIECHYEDDNEPHVFAKRTSADRSTLRPVYVNGVWYKSIATATRALGLKAGYLAPYLRGERKNKKYICEYANQQPSRGNSDDSTPEGSTTNE